VLNLVPDKVAAYEEIVRALRPGGRIQIADVCVEVEVPRDAREDIDLWKG
jgi:arsenite methyltransferase